MGEVRVPASARWGAQTQRAVENFPVSGWRVPLSVVHALALIKAEAATVNAQLAGLDRTLAEAIRAAALDVAAGAYDAEFPLDVFQTGSGTSTNMNVNEVVAKVAVERFLPPGLVPDPNDHVNLSQSSNDTFPSAMAIAALQALDRDLLPAVEGLSVSLRAKADAFRDVVKAGRTHLMDATPVTLGQELSGYAAQLSEAVERIGDTIPRVGRLPLGGTAVGTGVNCPPGFAAKVIERLADRLGLPLTEAPDHFAAQSARDAIVELSGQLRALAVALLKIANDIRWMGSGPRTGLGELRLPELQPGSSIMPGKVNPVLAEAVAQVAAQVFGADATIAFAGSQGAFELNTYLPVMAWNLLEAVRLMANVMTLFARRCIDGIEADVGRCRAFAESSPSLGTALNPVLGYAKAAELVKESVRSGRSVRDLVRDEGLMTDDELDAAFDLLAMARGERA